MPHGRGQVQRGALGLRRDGTFVGLWIDVLGDAGAYPIVGALIPNATVAMAPGTYRFARAGGRGRSTITNTTPMGAYRGAGRPEACALLERLVDIAARELDIDPVELRRRNLVPPDAFPYTSAMGMVYDSGDYAGCLDAALAALDYDGLRAEQAARRARGDAPLLGIGVAMWIDCTPMNRPGEYAAVDVVPDDGNPTGVRVIVRDGANDQGQGHRTTWAILLSDALGVPVECVELELGDTARVPTGEGTGSARSLMLAGNAVAEAGTLARSRRARSRPTCSKPRSTTSCSATTAASRWPAHRRSRCRGATSSTPSASRSRSTSSNPARRSRRACTPPSSKWTRRPARCGCCASSRSTTAGAS